MSSFSTKNRAPDIRPPVRQRLWRYIAGILRSSRAKVHTMNGSLDHIPTLPLADLMRLTKTNSSRWLRQEFPSHREFAWQPGYAAFSVSYSKFNQVLEYIAHQENHHCRHSVEEELVSLPRKNEIQFEEKYSGRRVWLLPGLAVPGHFPGGSRRRLLIRRSFDAAGMTERRQEGKPEPAVA